MAPGLVVPGVVRYTIKGHYLGVQVANILDVDIDTDFGASRNDNVLDQAKIIVSAWADHICGQLSTSYQATAVSWVDMNSAAGTTGETAEGTGTNFPHGGGDGGSTGAGMMAFLVHKQITAARGSRQGRMFLPGVTETATVDVDGNTVVGAKVIALNDALDAFMSDVNQDGGAYGSHIKVVHTKNNGTPADPVIVYVGQSEVTAMTVDTRVHTQRRRMG